MTKTALVLGGGGALGVAWEIGLLTGLQDSGVDVSASDLIVGTSAGSIVGTQIAAGKTLRELFAEQREPDDGRLSGLIQIELPESINLFRKWAGITEVTQQIAAEIGEMAMRVKTVAEDKWVAYFEDHLEGAVWPQRPLLLTAVDCESGAFQVWDRGSGVPLARAVASSCAVPGMFPPVAINGRRYTDGGVRSGTSADLARDHDAILIVAPIGARSDGIDPLLGSQARQEAEELRAAGKSVELVFPDAASLEAIGISRMDASRRKIVAAAGAEQAKALASKLTDAWRRIAA